MPKLEDKILYNITSMEIFKEGKWNGIDFNKKDILEMESNFIELKNKLVPKLKITHMEEQETLAGLASYGDITNIYAIEKDGVMSLYADVENVPEQVIDWVKSGRFAERSIELFFYYNIDDKEYKNVVYAIALLGNEIPAVSGLDKIVLAKDIEMQKQGKVAINFSLNSVDINFAKIKTKNNNVGGNKLDMKEILEDLKNSIVSLADQKAKLEFQLEKQKDENTISGLKSQIAKFEEEIAKAEDTKVALEEAEKKVVDAEAKVEEVVKENNELKEDVAKVDEEKVDNEANDFAETLSSEGKITPAVKEEVKQVYKKLARASEKLSFSIKKDDQEETVEKSQLETFKEIFSKLPKVVELGEISKFETSKDDGVKLGKEIKHGTQTFAVDNAEQVEVIQKYMKDNDCNYETALLAVSK